MSGLASFSITEVRDLQFIEKTDVYCLISVGRQIIRTSTSYADVGTPVEWFSEGYTFDITGDNSAISVDVWGVSTSYPTGKVLGQVSLPLHTIKTTSKEYGNTVTLLDENSRPIAATLRYIAHYSTHDRKVGFDDFTMIRFLGKGTFGKVMLVKKKDTGRLYAMKVMRKDKLYREAATALPLTERDVLKKYNHPYVVHLKYAFQTETHLYMVIDYLSGGDLFDLLMARNILDEDTTRFYAAQIVLAVSFLHEHDIIYRDLKPENLLIDMNGNMCLVDFGLCKEGMLGDQVTHTFCGSLQYMAPEVLKGEGYGKSVDWWALGVIIYEMLTGVHPFLKSRKSSFSDREIIYGIIHENVQFSTRVGILSKSAIKLLSSLLQKDPRRRLGSGPKGYEDVKNHPFFADINWKKLARKEQIPPFKPHLADASLDRHKEPWSVPDRSNSPVFEILNDSQQECFDQFSYTAPTELARSRSSPVFRLKHLSSSPHAGPLSPRMLSHLSSSPLCSPRSLARESSSPGAITSASSPLKMVRSPGFVTLSEMCDSEESDDEVESIITPVRRERRRWSASNFHVLKGDNAEDDRGDEDDGGRESEKESEKEKEKEKENESEKESEVPPSEEVVASPPKMKRSRSKLISSLNFKGIFGKKSE